jgi:hypothetical protein
LIALPARARCEERATELVEQVGFQSERAGEGLGGLGPELFDQRCGGHVFEHAGYEGQGAFGFAQTLEGLTRLLATREREGSRDGLTQLLDGSLDQILSEHVSAPRARRTLQLGP